MTQLSIPAKELQVGDTFDGLRDRIKFIEWVDPTPLDSRTGLCRFSAIVNHGGLVECVIGPERIVHVGRAA